MTIKNVYKVFILIPHKLFKEETGPYYDIRTVEGYYLRETNMSGDSEEECVNLIAEEGEEHYDYVIMPQVNISRF